MIAFSVTSIAAPAATKAKKTTVKKKQNGKIKPLAPGRKTPTLKKKYKKV